MIIRTIVQDFEQLKAMTMNDAYHVLKSIEQQGREDDFMNYLEEKTGAYEMTDTDLNNFIRFNSDIFLDAYDIEIIGDVSRETLGEALESIGEVIASFNLTYKPKMTK